jgi:hypothetical protein
MASIFTVEPVKHNKDRPVDILGPAIFVSSKMQPVDFSYFRVIQENTVLIFQFYK